MALKMGGGNDAEIFSKKIHFANNADQFLTCQEITPSRGGKKAETACPGVVNGNSSPNSVYGWFHGNLEH